MSTGSALNLPPTPAPPLPVRARAALVLQGFGLLSADHLAAVHRAVTNASNALFSKQKTGDGWGRPATLGISESVAGRHWCAELEGDTILSSEYILMKFILGQQDGPAERALLPRLANQIRIWQRPDGGWGQYPGSAADVSSCVKSYLCLKLLGDSPHASHMQAARQRVIALGGAESCNTFSNFYLACLGIISWEACPAIPPQIVLFPHWFPFHLRKVAAWTRTMILPLALCSALQPVRTLPRGPDGEPITIDELFIDASYKVKMSKPWSADLLTWNNFFLAADRFIKVCRRGGITPFRDEALAKAERWLLERMDPATTEGLGAIFPPMVYIQVALQKMGYDRSHPVVKTAERDLDAFIIHQPHDDPAKDHSRVQPCFSPVWDTAIALDALGEAGYTAANDARIAETCDWLRAREVTRRGDWIENLRRKDRHLQPGIDLACWAFEYRNEWYPDVDDTCMVARALHRAGDRPGETCNIDAAKRAVRFIFAMQNDDGGWAAFDRTKDRPWMEAVPFADHNAMQDPSCSDIAGRVLESLIACGVNHDHPAVSSGARYLIKTQQPEGSWLGRWGVNYIYGTWQAINGLAAARLDRDHPAMAKARTWLLSVQNLDGGFGESANSYTHRHLMGRGPSTASQTAWGLITLMHLVDAHHPSCQRAAQWLMDQQLQADKLPMVPGPEYRSVATSTGAEVMGGDLEHFDHLSDIAGSWHEHWFTGTGFPEVFYLRYHMYRHSFPLKALARYAALNTQH